MAGRQIRWGTVGRVAAVVAAAIAGIASLPALLGNDAPPPLPSDVGLTPPPVSTPAVVPHMPPTAVSRPQREHHRQSGRARDPGRSHPRRERTHQGADQRARRGATPTASAIPSYSPPVYSYVPPPQPG